MREDVLIATAMVELDKENHVQLDYFVRQLNAQDELFYALRLDMRGVSTVTPFFTGDYADIVKMAHAFAEGTVLPCTLVEMCDEWQSAHL